MTEQTFFIEVFTDTPELDKPKIIAQIGINPTTPAEDIGNRVLSIIHDHMEPEEEDVTHNPLFITLKKLSQTLDAMGDVVESLAKQL